MKNITIENPKMTLPNTVGYEDVPGELSLNSLLRDRMYRANRNWFTQEDVDAAIRLRDTMTKDRIVYTPTRPCYYCTDSDHKTAMHWSHYNWQTGEAMTEPVDMGEGEKENVDDPCDLPSVEILELGHDDPELREKALLIAIDIRQKGISNESLLTLTKQVFTWLLKGQL